MYHEAARRPGRGLGPDLAIPVPLLLELRTRGAVLGRNARRLRHRGRDAVGSDSALRFLEHRGAVRGLELPFGALDLLVIVIGILSLRLGSLRLLLTIPALSLSTLALALDGAALLGAATPVASARAEV